VIDTGRLVQVGRPRQIYSDPVSIYVATRLGQPAINLFPAGLIPAGGAPAGARTVGARTEHLRIARAANGSALGKVDWVEHLGDQNHLHVTVGAHKLISLVDPATDLLPGDKVALELIAPLYFDAAGNRC
jgi:multiple sugar transport system ATP-binding protein